MIRYILTKILNKYKLYLCLMIGNISIIMIFSLMMMFRDGSRMKLIQRGFTKQYESTALFPATIIRESNIQGEDIGDDPAAVIDKEISAYENSWKKYLDIPVVSTQRFVYYKAVEAEYSYRKGKHIGIGYLEDGMGNGTDISEHYNIISGADLYEDISKYTDGVTEIPDYSIPCLVSKTTATAYDIVPGEVINFAKLVYTDEVTDKPILSLYVSGIITEKEDDYFWDRTLDEMGLVAFIDKKDFCNVVKDHPKDVMYKTNVCFDYRYINTDNVYDIESVIKQFDKKDENLVENITPIIESYRENSRSVGQMLYVIVLPLIILVLIFIGMIAVRIVDSEAGELTTLRNRGLSKPKLIGMYIIQSFILAGVSVPLGVGAGFLFGKLVAGVDDFMGFHFIHNEISVRDYRFNLLMIIAGVIGSLLAVIVMMVPVFGAFRKKKSTRRSNTSAPTWEKYFLDVVLLIVSVYLLFNYNRQISTLSIGVLNGEGIDPVIFIDSTLFLFACGMLMLRLIFYVVRLIYRMGEKKFGPVTYAGLLEILRTRKASSVISVFLVMTVAMSVFNANMARTINANKEARLQYECGADVRIQENWPLQLMQSAPGAPYRFKYHEPSYEAYNRLKDDGTFDSITKVLITDRAQAGAKGKDKTEIEFMAINTKEFGATAKLKENLSEEHWYNYLNALASDPDGIIISSSLAKKYAVKVGDPLVVYMRKPAVCNEKDPYASVNYKVVAIVDAWPGFNNYSYAPDVNGKIEEHNNYLIVANYGNALASFGDLPYEVWASVGKTTGTDKFGKGVDEKEVREKVLEAYGDSKRTIKSVTSWKTETQEEKSTAIIQITNGLFTADFLVALILCIIGYMIYWITSIRDRELLFGIYRAQGITKKEINKMLIIEQAFLSIMAIVAGIIAGLLASKFFARIFAAVYLPQKHSVSVFVNANVGDMLRLGAVLILVVAICVVWIRRIVRGLNITEALKLGEDS